MAIIKSILDTDLYKFTTSYAYSKLFPRAYGELNLWTGTTAIILTVSTNCCARNWRICRNFILQKMKSNSCGKIYLISRLFISIT